MTKVRFDSIDPRILPEMSAKVSFLTKEVTDHEQRALTAVNPDAIATRAGRNVLFIVRDDVANEVAVTTGETIGGAIAVSGAVKTGDRAVLRPPPDLTDRARVRIATK
jgi:hypothetical protein